MENDQGDGNTISLPASNESEGILIECYPAERNTGALSEHFPSIPSCNAEYGTMSHSSKFGFFETRSKDFNGLELKARDTMLPTIVKNIDRTSMMQLSRWNLAAEAMHHYQVIGNRVQARQCIGSEGQRTWFEPNVEERVVDKARNWPSKGLFRGVETHIMGMVLWLVSVAYGGLHAAAWNSYFPSTAEAFMWRSSAVWIASCGVLWVSINWLAHESKSVKEYWARVVTLEAHWTSYLVLGIVCSMCGIAYVYARVFLVVEAFISIRQLQIAVYNTPTWTQLISHL